MSIEIKINDKFEIRSDAYNFILCETGIVAEGATKGEKYRRVLSYHSSLEAVLGAVIDQTIKKSDSSTAQQLCESIKQVHDDIKSAMEPIRAIKLNIGNVKLK